MEAIRIIKEMRERGRADGRTNEFGDVFPRFAIWENVAGAFSSNGGEDFRCVLEEFCNIKGKDIIIPQPKNGKWDKAGIIIGDGFSVAWRLFDAQYWGVPQRRKRIAVVGDFAGWSAGEILFEREGVRRDIAESEQEGQGTSRSVGESSKGTDRAFTLKIRGGADTYIKSDGSVGTAGKGPLIQDNLSGTLGVSQDQTLFCKGVIPMQDDGTTSMTKHGPGWHEEDVGYTVNTVDRQSVAYGIGRDAFNMGENAQFGMSIEENTQPPITAKGAGGGMQQTIGSLCARDYKGVGNQYVSDGKCIVSSI